MTINEIAKSIEISRRGFKTELATLDEITKRAKERINRERKQDSERIRELEGVTGSETIVSLAKGEIEELKRKQYGTTEAERELANKSERFCNEMVTEIRALKPQFQSKFEEEQKRLAELKKSALSDDLELMGRWVSSSFREFDELE